MMMKNIKTVKYSLIRTTALCIAIILSMTFTSKAQDKIHKTDSTVIEAKVLEVNTNEIKYKKFSNQNGPTYTVNKNEVKMIVYENGEKEIYNTGNTASIKPVNLIKKDSIQCIEDLWGVKFENTQENDGGVKIVKREGNSIFKQGISMGVRGTLLTEKLTICYVNCGTKVRVKNTTELARALFASYNQGISKIDLLSERGKKLSVLTNDHKGIDITNLSKCQGADSTSKKLGTEESKKAGQTVAGIYHPGQMWAMQGFCSGLVFGVAGLAVVGGIAELSVSPNKIPVASPNVDATAWSKGYKSQIRKKRLISGLLGSIAGAILIIGAASSVN